ncbi:MAG: DUF2098 domain-containing protein [Candidatus Methanomethylicus sp.]|nr:DUF2098 domain-containing protein [Candidatus Methanomethylicus sp.]
MRHAEGDDVVYTKTGTTGKIVKIHQLDGKTWAELDSTGLLYDINSLEPKKEMEHARRVKEARREKKEDKAPDLTKDDGTIDTSGSVAGGG